MPGPDHWFSEEPEDLKKWVSDVRIAYQMLGSEDLQPTEKEMQIRNEYHRSITTSCDIEQGEVFTEQNLCMRRPGDGLSGSRWDDVIGKQAKHDIKANVQLTMEDIM